MKATAIIPVTLSILSFSAEAQFITTPAKDNTIAVAGVAITKEIPENIFVQITVKSEDRDYSRCQDLLLRKMGTVKSSILRQNISKDLLKTDEISIDEKREFIDGRQEKTGYSGSISLSIETRFSPEFANKILTAIRSDTSSAEYNIRFRLSEGQKTRLRQEAIALAVDDAKEKAMLLAKSSNLRLAGINTISYSDDAAYLDQDRDIVKEVIYPSQAVYCMVASPDNSLNIDFNPKEIGIYKSVHIEWKIAEESK